MDCPSSKEARSLKAHGITNRIHSAEKNKAICSRKKQNAWLASSLAACLTLSASGTFTRLQAQEPEEAEVHRSDVPADGVGISLSSAQKVRRIDMTHSGKTVEEWVALYDGKDPLSLGILGFLLTRPEKEAAAVLIYGLENGIGDLHDSRDAMSIAHFRQALDYIDQCNALRRQENQPELSVSLTMMAVAMVQTDYSSNSLDHSRIFDVGENLYWGGSTGTPFGSGSNPFDYWYTREKPERGSHYRNIVDPRYVLTGFAIAQNGKNPGPLFGQVFFFQDAAETMYTTDELRGALNEYEQKALEGTWEPQPGDGNQNMYRLYNPNSGEHFYTADRNERNSLIRFGWRYEGIGWIAPYTGSAVYRLYNPNVGDHHYTLKETEKDFLVSQGWTEEKIGWYSNTDQASALPLYRAYNPNAKTGAHNFTVSAAEQKFLTENGWKGEGVAWYGVKLRK